METGLTDAELRIRYQNTSTTMKTFYMPNAPVGWPGYSMVLVKANSAEGAAQIFNAQARKSSIMTIFVLSASDFKELGNSPLIFNSVVDPKMTDTHFNNMK